MQSADIGAPTKSTVNLITLFVGLDGAPADTQCLLCNSTFILPTNKEQFLKHLFERHRLIIGDVLKIASLRSYVNHWRVKFSEATLTEFCTTLLMNCTPDGKPSKNEVYFLLSDCLPEEKALRDEIHRSRLELGLAQQTHERNDMDFQRRCMFCKTEFSGLRSNYLKHLSDKHNLQLGNVENLVFVDELLDKLQNNIEKLTCFYCEKSFKDRTVLKEHMRKKFHKRINPYNKSYDRFYIINYLESNDSGRRQQLKEINEVEFTGFSTGHQDAENSWADWKEKNVVTCLFCSNKNEEFSEILEHMKFEHNFDFRDKTRSLNFYCKVKVVNYLRKQSHEKKCIYCDSFYDDVAEHMRKENHENLPAAHVWNQPE
ncbi:zinc finger protein 277 isoform X2 [Diachasma alloeum]|uniref:zinc finger protein 277 isoform X2 n=1 Tax=Diachasma alloeum TaxID=454923 RepID=UPI000738170D|nr:zinc finger protein 277 isoform X2 [Diachasma alloeum]